MTSYGWVVCPSSAWINPTLRRETSPHRTAGLHVQPLPGLFQLCGWRHPYRAIEPPPYGWALVQPKRWSTRSVAEGGELHSYGWALCPAAAWVIPTIRRETSPLRTVGFLSSRCLGYSNIAEGDQPPPYGWALCPTAAWIIPTLPREMIVLSWSPECEACCKHHERSLTYGLQLFDLETFGQISSPVRRPARTGLRFTRSVRRPASTGG